MDNRNSSNLPAKGIGALLVFVFGTILVFGLWPFHAPVNQVRWLRDGNGIEFGHYGSVMSAGALAVKSEASLDIWLESNRAGQNNTILAFDGFGGGGWGGGEPSFALRQDGIALEVLRYNIDERGTIRTAGFKIPGICAKRRRVFVTVVLSNNETEVYLDGERAAKSPILGESTESFTGRMVLADSPFFNDSWSGRILGIAIYQGALTQEQAAEHYSGWKASASSPANANASTNRNLVARYDFSERTGNMIHSLSPRQAGAQAMPVPDFEIPDRYSMMHKTLLASVLRNWKHWPDWGYWQDVVINIVGFMPMGFALMVGFSRTRTSNLGATLAILIGLMTSLAIETTQAYLPTRDSDMTDVLTNTLGTALGVVLYRCPAVQGLWSKAARFAMSRFAGAGSAGSRAVQNSDG